MNEHGQKARIQGERHDIELMDMELEQVCGGASPKLMLACATGQHAPSGGMVAMADGSVRSVSH
jgi:prepilin-type processing-associated H-X9-DG protein